MALTILGGGRQLGGNGASRGQASSLEQNLVASRLVKEATDQIALESQVALSRQGPSAGNEAGARAFVGNKTLVEIKGNEHATAGLYNGRSNRSLALVVLVVNLFGLVMGGYGRLTKVDASEPTNWYCLSAS